MSLIKQINTFAKTVGKELRKTNKSIEELSVRVLITLSNKNPFVIGGHQLILLDSEMKPHAITNGETPNTNKERYKGGFDIDHIYFYGGDKVKPFTTFARKEIYSRHPDVDFKLSSNCGDRLEPNKPVYLVCGWDEDTSEYYLAKKWWTQELPTEEDGLIYKHIGFAKRNSKIQFFNDGVAYSFKRGKVITIVQGKDEVVVVDEELDVESTNAISNSVVTQVITEIKETLYSNESKIDEYAKIFYEQFEDKTKEEKPENP